MLDNTYKKNSEEWQIVHNLQKAMGEGVMYCEPKHKRALENNDMTRGEQWSQGDAERQKLREKPTMALNGLVKIVNAIANREIMDRIVPRVYGRNQDDNGVAQVLDLTCNWQRDMAETEHEETMAFRNCVTSGYGVMHKWWDPAASDGAGLVRDESIPLWYLIWDSRARKQNLVDRKWHACGKYVPVEELEMEFGSLNKQTKRMFKEIADGAGMHVEADPYSRPGGLHGAGTWGQILSNKWVTSSKREVFVIEYEWEETENFYKAAIPVRFDDYVNLVTNPEGSISISGPNGQEQVITSAQFGQLDPQIQRQFMLQILQETNVEHFDDLSQLEVFMEQFENVVGDEFLDYRKERRYTYKYAIVSNNVVLDHGVRPFGFTYEFLTGFPHEKREETDFFGMVDISKAAQDFKNVFFSNLLTIYMTSPKQHLLIEESALQDVDRFLDEYAKVSGVSIVPEGFVGQQRFLQLEKPTFPPMLPELIQLTENTVERNLGLSSIESGQQDDLRRVSGNVVQAARQSSNTLLAILFDALRRYRRRFGMLNLKFMTAYYDPKDIINIVGMDKAQYVQGLDNWPQVVFDIKIDESPTTVTEQMETIDFLTRTGTLDNWKAAGDIEFDDILDLLVNVPQSTRDKIRQRREERGVKEQQIQQLQGQLQTLSEKYDAFYKFVQANQGGSLIVAQYNMLSALAAEQVQQAEQQKQQAQQGQQQGA